MAHKYTEEEKEYLREIVPGKHFDEIIDLMYKRFGITFTRSQIKGINRRLGLKTGFTGRFEKGSEPFLKGSKRIAKANKTSFQKGRVSLNKREVGETRVNSYGYREIKIAEPNVWKYERKIVWENHHGEIPKNHVLFSADGDKLNSNIENLRLIHRGVLAMINNNGFINLCTSPEVTDNIILIAKIMLKSSEVIRNKNKRKEG